jgi:hypothetical protein
MASKPPSSMSPSSTHYTGARGGYTKRGSAATPPAAMTTPKSTGLKTPTPRRQPSVPDNPQVQPPHSYSGGDRD